MSDLADAVADVLKASGAMSDGESDGEAEVERREAEMWAATTPGAEHQPWLLDRALMVRATACELARDAALDRARAAEEENRELRRTMAAARAKADTERAAKEKADAKADAEARKNAEAERAAKARAAEEKAAAERAAKTKWPRLARTVAKERKRVEAVPLARDAAALGLRGGERAAFERATRKLERKARAAEERAHVEALTTSTRIWRYGGLFVVLAMLCAIFAEFQAIETASSATVPGLLPGGYTCGERIYYTGPSKTFPTGNKVTHGQEGEVTGQPDSDHPVFGKGVRVMFPGNTQKAMSVFLEHLSRIPPPPLPGGYALGDKVYYTGKSMTIRSNQYTHGQLGVVTGQPERGNPMFGKGVVVMFSESNVNVYLPEISRTPPTLPGGFAVGEMVFSTALKRYGHVIGGAQSGYPNYLSVQFPGYKGSIECGIDDLSRGGRPAF